MIFTSRKVNQDVQVLMIDYSFHQDFCWQLEKKTTGLRLERSLPLIGGPKTCTHPRKPTHHDKQLPANIQNEWQGIVVCSANASAKDSVTVNLTPSPFTGWTGPNVTWRKLHSSKYIWKDTSNSCAFIKELYPIVHISHHVKAACQQSKIDWSQRWLQNSPTTELHTSRARPCPIHAGSAILAITERKRGRVTAGLPTTLVHHGPLKRPRCCTDTHFNLFPQFIFRLWTRCLLKTAGTATSQWLASVIISSLNKYSTYGFSMVFIILGHSSGCLWPANEPYNWCPLCFNDPRSPKLRLHHIRCGAWNFCVQRLCHIWIPILRSKAVTKDKFCYFCSGLDYTSTKCFGRVICSCFDGLSYLSYLQQMLQTGYTKSL